VEGIIILLILYFVFKKIAQRGKQIIGKTDAANQGNPSPTRVQTVREPQIIHRKPVNVIPPKAQTMMSQTQSNEHYQPIQPMISLGGNLHPYSGSLSAVSTEGSASPAGIASEEGTAIPTVTANLEGSVATEGAVSDEGGKMLPDSLLSSGNHAYAFTENEQVCAVIPAEWNRDAFVQGIVMKEILDRPRRRGYSHG
jgi:hypothetical protein